MEQQRLDEMTVHLFIKQITEYFKEYWSGLPCPPPGDLRNPEIELASLKFPALIGGFFISSTPQYLENLPAVQGIWLQCRRPRFYPWVGKIPWGSKWQPIPVFLPGKSHGQRAGGPSWVHEITRVGHNLMTKPTPLNILSPVLRPTAQKKKFLSKYYYSFTMHMVTPKFW